MPEKLKLCYTIRGLARELGIDHQYLRRLLIKGFKEKQQPVLRNGKLWISDIKDLMPAFYDSWIEFRHQKSMNRRPTIDDEDF